MPLGSIGVRIVVDEDRQENTIELIQKIFPLKETNTVD